MAAIPRESRELLEGLRDDIQRHAGDALIGLGYHYDQEWEAIYLREDFVAAHPPEEQETLAEDVIIQGLSKPTLEAMWGFGSLEYTLREFEEAHLLHFAISETKGVVVGLDSLPRERLDAVIETCLDYRPRLE